MIILHAGSLGEGLILWGETPEESTGVLPKRRGRKPKIPHPDLFPFDPGEGGLKKSLQAVRLKNISYGVKSSRITAWIPTITGKPLVSSPMIAEPIKSRAKPTLTPWQVTGFSLSTTNVIELLCACIGKHILAPGIIVGKDLAFWMAAMRFAGSLAARQRFLPGIIQDNDTFNARWEPIIMGRDLNRMAKLTQAMPPSCRALTGNTDLPPSTPSKTVLTGFIGQIVDYLVRTSSNSTSVRVQPKRGRKKKSPSFDSIHDQWLHALQSPEGTIEDDSNELALFANQVRMWRRPIYLTAAAPFRLCFRLEEPSTDDENDRRIQTENELWRVRYLLQAIDDPSLLIPANDVWNNKKRKVQSVFKSYNFNAQEYLLFTLGQALSICPRIESSLKVSSPVGYEFHSAGAFEFLNERAMTLEQAGFVVMLPAWWTRKGTKQRLTIQANVKSPKMKGGGKLTLESIVKFDWEIALGGEKLTLRELRQLAKLKAPLVKVRGEWVQLDSAEIQAAIDFWQNKSDESTLLEVVQMSLGKARTPGGIAFDGIKAKGKVGEFLSQLTGEASMKELEAPEGFIGTLRPYQARGFSWLSFLRQWGLGACLADDMGLGKTIQALALIQSDWESDCKRPILLICPTSVMENWRRETERFTPELPAFVHHGPARAKGAAFKTKAVKQAIVISSYALLHRDFNSFKSVKWAGIILDEAQNIKNPETKQSKSARTLNADFRIAMTGTPVENNVGDLWSIMEFLNPDFLGKQSEFKRNFFIPIQTRGDAGAIKNLKRLTGPFLLRRLKTDKSIISDLPKKVEMKVFSALTKEQASLYEAIVNETMKALNDTEGIQRKGLVLATLSKLKQVCNHPAQFLGDNSSIHRRSGKLNRLTEMLEELLESDNRALIFTQFAEMGSILKRYLQETFGQEVLFLYGAVRKNKRDKMIERFQSENGGPRIFILSLKAGGTGLNLTKANHVFHFDRWWNPAVENQATDRAYRIGQTKNVMVHKFICSGTLEERIDEMIESKKEIASKVVGTGEGWLTELTTAELKEVFALRRGAMED